MQPAPTPAAIDRTEGLSDAARRLLAEATAALQRRDPPAFARTATALRALAPKHPETLRLLAALARLQGRPGEAIDLLHEAALARPGDTLVLSNLAQALAAAGATTQAATLLRRCVELEPTQEGHGLALAALFERANDFEAAVEVLEGLLERDPTRVATRIALARALFALGRGEHAAAQYRQVLAIAPGAAAAWYGLSTLRSPPFDTADADAIERLLARGELDTAARASLGFALARAHEVLQRPDEAWNALVAANAAWRRQQSWDGPKMSLHLREIRAAFAAAEGSDDAGRGAGLVFIVGLPRSGSSVVEQVLAAHPEVAAGGELEHVPAILRGESARRRRDFPHWVPQATAADWRRLGDAYLGGVRARRGEQRVFTDKGLLNWIYLGALRRMLPGARFVDCRRDPLETCLACYRQMFAQALGFTYELAELARFWHDYDATMRHWHGLHAPALLELHHEALVAEPAREIRRLLDFCGLPFDEACLRAHEAPRGVRTLSAHQLREPLRPRPPRASFYGNRLDGLRTLLATEPA